MPYEAGKDRYPRDAHALIFARRATVVTVDAADFTATFGGIAGAYPKALSVWVTPGTTNGSITIRPSGNGDAGGDLVTLALPEGRTIIDFVQVRAVTAFTGGASGQILRLDD